jgi:hypothetical protein
MPGSLTTRSRAASRDGEAARVVFGVRHTLNAPDGITIAARWLAYAHPYRRFAPALADRHARLGADVGRYSFITEDLHLLSPAGLPAHVAVGTGLATRPPLRSRRAQFGHRAPISGE